MPDLFIGSWDLIPELSLYAVGDPPASGTYELRQEGSWIHVLVSWTTTPMGAESRLAYGGPLDGTPQPLPVRAGAPDSMTLTRIDARTLDSAALRGTDLVAWARRRVSNDGTLLSVVQEARQPHGQIARNFQVYRRVHSIRSK